ncbi:MAG: hypothetical protein M1818_002012 [Claussenomyces sp. TS43310]|nr:MAG: hypothetical protein M1818_002012 [Claussenomyces sp. TS43310]
MSLSSYETPRGNLEPFAPKAGLACTSCRRQKRKCDKGLPGCGLCVRMGRSCDYSAPSSTPTADDFNALRLQLQELENRLNGSNASSVHTGQPPYTSASTLATTNGSGAPPVYIQHDPAFTNVQNRFPVIAFIDSEAFRYGQISIPKPNVEIPVEVLGILGDAPAVQAVISDFFASVHVWMPIISKKRMSRNMVNPMWEAGPDLVLLFLCMKLVMTRPQEGFETAQNSTYMAAKRFLLLTELSGMTSLLVLQSYILTCLYEMEQAIYPGAWMTAGTCVKYGLLLGINEHPDVPKLLGRPSTWIELEERERTWWAVLIIDRIVSLGGQGRFFASQDPDVSAPLPVDTISWDEGEMVAALPLGTSSSIAEPRSPFARLCQASILLGKILRHHYSPLQPEIHQFQHASELYLEASTMARLLTKEAEESFDEYLVHTAPLAVCLSALSALCDPYACIEHRSSEPSSGEGAAMQARAVEGIRSVSASVKEMSEQIVTRATHSLDIDTISPFIFDALYVAAANFAWLVRENGDEACAQSLDTLRHCLRRLGGRFGVSLSVLRILEAQEFTYAVERPL